MKRHKRFKQSYIDVCFFHKLACDRRIDWIFQRFFFNREVKSAFK